MFDNINLVVRAKEEGMDAVYSKTKKLNQAFSNINKDANRSSSGIASMGKAFNGLNQIIGVGKLYMLADFFAKNIQGAIDMTETVNMFNVALGDTAVQTSKSLDKMHDMFGLDLTNLENSAGTFASLSRSMGMSTQQSSTLSVNMVKLATDLSSLYNIPVAQTMADLKSGLVGQSETVYKYGVDVTEAGIKAEAMRQGITKSVREMSQGEKMALRYSAMIRQTGLAQGDLARTLDTPANQLRILQERFVTLGRAIGGIFISAIGGLLPYLNAFVLILTDVANKIATFFGWQPPKVENTYKSAVGGMTDGTDALGNAMDKTGAKAKKMKNSLMGFDEINTLPKASDVSGTSGGLGGPSILPNIKLDSFNNGMDSIKSKVDEIKQNILETSKTITDFINKIPIEQIVFLASAFGLLWTIGMIGKLPEIFLDLAIAFDSLTGLPLLGGMFAQLSELALSVGSSFETLAVIIGGLTAPEIALIIGIIALTITTIVSLWKNCEDFRNGWTEVWNNIMGVLKAIWDDIIKPIFDSLVKEFYIIYEGGLKPLWSSWLYVWNEISGIITTILNGVIFPIFKFLVSLIGSTVVPMIQYLMPVFAVVFDGILGTLSGAFKTIGDVFRAIKQILQGLIDFVTGVFTGNWSKAWQGVKEIFSGIFSGLGAILTYPINAIIDGVNGMIRGLNKIQLPDWDLIPASMRGKGFNISLIPRLANGGILDGGGQLFQAGENGKAEMLGSYQGKTTVMPLENTSFVEAMHDAVYGAVTTAIGSGTGNNGDIILQVGSTEFGRIAVDSINKLTKQEGRLALNI